MVQRNEIYQGFKLPNTAKSFKKQTNTVCIFPHQFIGCVCVLLCVSFSKTVSSDPVISVSVLVSILTISETDCRKDHM